MDKSQLQQIADTFHRMDELAILSLSRADYEGALKIYKEILKAEESFGFLEESGHTMMNLANTLLLLHRMEEGLAYVRKAEAVFKELSVQTDLVQAKLLAARFLCLLGNVDEARMEGEKALSLSRSDSLRGECTLLLFDCWLRLGNKTKARSSIDRSISYFELSHDTGALCRALRARINYFETNGQAIYASSDKAHLAILEAEHGAR